LEAGFPIRGRLRPLAAACLVLAMVLTGPGAAEAAKKFQLMPALSVVGEYDDNVLLVPDESDAEKEWDVSVAANPSLAMTYTSYYTNARIGAAAGFKHFFEEPDNDNNPEFTSGEILYGRWATPRIRVEFSDRFFYFLDQRQAEEEDPLIPRTESITNNIEARMLNSVAMRTRLNFTFRLITVEFEEVEIQDSFEHDAELELEQRVGVNYLLRGFYAFRRVVYDDDMDMFRSQFDDEFRAPDRYPSNLSGEQDFDVHTVGAGVDYQLTPTFSVQVMSGVLFPAVLEEDVYKLSQLDWAQSLTLTRAFEFMNLNAGYHREIQPAHGTSGAALTQRFVLDLDRTWFRDFTTVLSGGYSKYDLDPGTTDSYNGSIMVRYQVWRWMGVSLTYSHLTQIRQLGEEEEENLKINRVILVLTFLPPRPDLLRF